MEDFATRSLRCIFSRTANLLCSSLAQMEKKTHLSRL
jgi:hypothetical protein